MHFFIQTTLIHQARVSITIIRSRFNQNRNNFIKNLILHLDNRCVVVHMPVIQCCIDSRNDLPSIPNYLHLLCIVNMRSTTLILRKIFLKILLTTCPTLQLTPTITSVLLFSMMRSIKLLVRYNILFLTYIPRSFLFLNTIYFSLVFPFPTLLIFCLTL